LSGAVCTIKHSFFLFWPNNANKLRSSITFYLQLFGHIASDAMLKPLGQFTEAPLASNYPPTYAGEYVEQELSLINLKGKNGL
jgi:hypothetical protein